MKKSLVFTAVLLSGGSLHATSIETEDSAKVRDIEEIVVVSAPKETARLRQMPVSVSLMDLTDLTRSHTTSLKELSAYVPNFYMPDYGSSLTSAAYIRGIGSRINTPAVGLYVDNVAYADKSAYDINFLDIERVDVLRGPQATLYGRNAMGGLIRVFTRDPFRYQGTDVHLSHSVKDIGYDLSASHHHRINRHAAFSLGGFYTHSKGFYTNTQRHENVGGREAGGGRTRWTWMPNGRLRFDFSTDYSYREDRGYPYQYRGATNAEEEEMPEHIGHIFYNNPTFYRRSLLNSSLHVRYTADRYVLSSVTAYQNLNDNMTLDQDFTAKDYFAITQKQRINSWSEELTFKSRSRTYWEWVNGVYALRQTLRTQSPVSLTESFMNTAFDRANTAMAPVGMQLAMTMHNPPFRADGAFDTPTTDLAVFHQSTFNNLFRINGLSLTAGLRIEYEKMQLAYCYGGTLNYDVTLTSPMMPLPLNGLTDVSDYQGKLDHDYVQWLPKVALQYHFNGNNIYASWSKGYRSGGYNIQMFSDLVQGDLQSRMMSTLKTQTEAAFSRPPYLMMPESVKQMILSKIPQSEYYGDPSQTHYKPEYSYNYEVGGHFSFWNGKIETDMAVFYMDIYDQQISKFVSSGLGRVMVNAGRGQSCGAEISLRGMLLDNRLAWNASYGYTHSVFKRYEAQGAHADAAQEAVQYDGNYVPFVPEHTMTAGIEYQHPVQRRAFKSFFFGIHTTGAGNIYWGEDNLYKQKFYALLNAHAGMDFGAIRINLWGKNLTDTRYDSFFFTSQATTRSLKYGQRGNPLQVGMDISLHF